MRTESITHHTHSPRGPLSCSKCALYNRILNTFGKDDCITPPQVAKAIGVSPELVLKVVCKFAHPPHRKANKKHGWRATRGGTPSDAKPFAAWPEPERRA